MKIYGNIQFLKPVFEQESRLLTGKLSDRHTADIKSLIPICLDQTENIGVIGDSKIPADLILLDIFRADYDDDLGLIAQFLEQAEFAVGSKSRKNTGCVEVIKKLSSEFEVKLVVEMTDSGTDVFRLHFQVFFIIKTNFHF